MLLPRIFDGAFTDSFFDDMFSFPMQFTAPTNWMKTDVTDLGDHYQLEIELPGYDKKDIHANLENGYLTISAEKNETKDENDKEGKYVRKERYRGYCKRSFYVGDNLKEEDFQASFENGILRMTFPKDNIAARIEDKKFIEIR
jgi:HSP20 family protein